MTDIDPDIKKALDERIDWINAVVARERKHGPAAVQQAINDLDAEHLRSVIYVLMLQRINDVKTLEQMDGKRRAAGTN